MTEKHHHSTPADWHNADIVAAVWKRGSTLRKLSRAHGLTNCVLRHALDMPYPRAERIIADFIGVSPQTIWPSRYGPDGKSNRRRGRPLKSL